MQMPHPALQNARPNAIRAVALLLLCSVTFSVSAARFQDGFNFYNAGNTSGKLSVSFSGNFLGEEPICLIVTDEVRVRPDKKVNISPPVGFTVSDIVIFWVKRAAVVDANGNFVFDANGNLVFRDAPVRVANIDDPPGAVPPEFVLHESQTDPTFNYLYVGPGMQIGPVVTSAPIVTDGTQTEGVPNLFVAKLDEETRHPIMNAGAGHCFIPSSVRANEPGSTKVHEHLLFKGATETYGVITAASTPKTKNRE